MSGPRRSVLALPLLLCFLCPMTLRADRPMIPPDTTVPSATDEEEVSGDDEYSEYLGWVREHPFDLNRVSTAELLTLPGVTAHDARAIVGLRKRLGLYATPGDLRLIDTGLVMRLAPYVTASPMPGPGVPRVTLKARYQLVEPGSIPAGSLGSAGKFYSRVTLKPLDRVEVGAQFEKDPGERTRYGFASGYISLRDTGPISEAVAGDMSFVSGSGLLFGSRGSPDRQSLGVRGGGAGRATLSPLRTPDESRHLRGIGVRVAVPVGSSRIEAATLAAVVPRAATLSSDGMIQTLPEDGLFRTGSELSRLHAVIERVFAGRVGWRLEDSWSAGVTAGNIGFDRKFTPDALGRRRDQRTTLVALDAHASVGPFALAGEVAKSGTTGSGALLELGIQPVPWCAVDILLHHASPGTASVHGVSPEGNGPPSNRTGVVIGWRLRLLPWIEMWGVAEGFGTQWRTATEQLPVRGEEWSIGCRIRPTKPWSLEGRCRLTTSTTTRRLEGTGPVAVGEGDERRLTMRLEGRYAPYPTMELRSRLEHTIYERRPIGEIFRGILVFQEVRLAIRPGQRIDARLTLFDAGDYGARVYAAEDHVAGVYAVPAFWGRGARGTVFISSRILGCLTLSARWAVTVIMNQPSSDVRTSTAERRVRDLALQADVRL